MDEQLNNNLPNNDENTVPVETEGEGFVAPVEAENVGKEENAVSFEAVETVAAEEQTSQWNGGYSYENPNPYQNYDAEPYVIKKKSNFSLVVASITAAGIMLICCIAIVVAQLVNWSDMKDLPSKDEDKTENSQNKEDSTNNQTQSAQRDEEAIYNMPEISKGEKAENTLSIVEINKKVKSSVVAVLIAEKSGEETVFSGSGFIISQDGYIITNAHVVENAAVVEVVLIDGITSFNATIVGQDERSDIAILKVEATGLSPVELGDSDDLEEGEEVVCIGNPYGMELSGSITNGIVSALNRKIEMNGGYMTLIQTNADINPGNSGGPLINAYGQVVGITSSKLVATGYEGIGFAIPINDAIHLSEELINYGYVKSRAYIGFSGQDLTSDYAKYYNYPQGVYVVYVNPDSDAAKKGLQEKDIVVGFNGKEVKSMAELNALKDSFHPNDQVSIKVWRNGETFDLDIVLGEASK